MRIYIFYMYTYIILTGIFNYFQSVYKKVFSLFFVTFNVPLDGGSPNIEFPGQCIFQTSTCFPFLWNLPHLLQHSWGKLEISKFSGRVWLAAAGDRTRGLRVIGYPMHHSRGYIRKLNKYITTRKLKPDLKIWLHSSF